MCCPHDYHYRHGRLDRHLGHRIVSRAFANYITRNPTLHCRSPRSPASSPKLLEEPLDLYMARVIHAAAVPDIVAYAALYLLASISQACQCRVPHGESKLSYDLSSPTKLSHIISRATTRTPFCRVAKSYWTERHLFLGAFYLAMIAYKPIFAQEYHKELQYWRMFRECGISEEEIGDVSAAFQKCIDYDLDMAIRSMLRDKCVIDVSEFDCPFALARQRRFLNAEDRNGDEKRQKRRMGLKHINSFWKPQEKATRVESDGPQWSVNCGPNMGSEHSYFYP